MPLDRYLIAPFDENSGLNTSVRPWQIPDQAWAQMNNTYVFRGRIRKRFGSKYMGSGQSAKTASLTSRLRIQVGTIGAPTSPVPGSVFQPGQAFSAGTQIFTVYQNGAMLATGPGTGTFNTATGAFSLAATGLANATPVYFYPGLPVMGLTQYDFAAVNAYPTIGFDTQFAYQFSNGNWLLSPGSPTWHGADNNFFWTQNLIFPNAAATALTRALFATNFYVVNPNGTGNANDDPIYYFNNATWTAYIPYLNPGAANAPATGPFVKTALMIFGFYGRMVILNTIENDGTGGGGTNTNYVGRMRWSNLGNIFAVNAWYGPGATDNAGNLGQTSGFSDASTGEAIISAEFKNDRLIVYFEQSTWEIVYTQNEQKPFRWQKLNTELGSMSTFSTIAFDKAVLTVGETGIHSCNGANVVRIDSKIPSEIFDISNPATQTERVCGIRDYYNELVYWAVPISKQISAQPYPTKVLVYNYQNETWAYNDDVITAFGYFDGQSGQTWATLVGTWAEWNTTWASAQSQAQVRQVIAGNQEGYTFIIDTDTSATPRNAGVLQVTQMTQPGNGIEVTVYNHMVQTGEFVYLENAQGVVLNGNAIYIAIYVDQNTLTLIYPPELHIPSTFTGTYTGGGTLARVSNYNMYSKQWNPYDKDGQNVYLAKIDFGVLATATGEVTIDYSPSSTQLSSVNEGEGTNTLMGTSVLETHPYPANLYPLEQLQNRLWHPIYFQTDGECIQINIYMSDAQMCNPAISLVDFEIEGMVLHTKRVSTRLQ